jgi:hypothetical protein
MTNETEARRHMAQVRLYDKDGINPDGIAALIADGECITERELVARMDALTPTFNEYHEPVPSSAHLDNLAAVTWALNLGIIKRTFDGPTAKVTK